MISSFKPNLNSTNKVNFIFDWRKEWLNIYFTPEFEGYNSSNEKGNLINQSSIKIKAKFNKNKLTSTGELYCKNSPNSVKSKFYFKQTKVMLFMQLNNDLIQILPISLQNKLSSGYNTTKLEKVF